MTVNVTSDIVFKKERIKEKKRLVIILIFIPNQPNHVFLPHSNLISSTRLEMVPHLLSRPLK